MKLISAVLTTLFLLAKSSHAYAADITIAVDQSDWRPMSWIEDKRAYGIEVEIVNQTMKRLGHQVNWRPLPWSRLLLEVNQGKVDAAVGLGRTKERESFLAFSEEPTYQMAPILVGTDMAKLRTAMDPDNDATILATEGYNYGLPLNKNIKNRRFNVESQTNILDMLRRRRADYGILNVSLINGLPVWDGLSDFVYVPTQIRERGVHIGFSLAAGHAGIAQHFSEKLKQVKQSDFIEQLMAKYLKGH